MGVPCAIPPMTTDYSRTAPVASTNAATRHLGLLILRLTAGGSLLFWYGGRQALVGWSHIWHKTPWALPGQLTSLGFPLGVPTAIFLVVLTLLGSLFVMIGLLTRLSALSLGLVASVTALLFTAHPAIEEPAILYTGLCLAISLCGPGLLALDEVLKSKSRRRP